MKSLIIDTSTKTLFCFIYDEVKKVSLYERIIQDAMHSENIVSVLEEGLNLCGIEIKDLSKIIVGNGPGSFTGLRVAMTVCKMSSFFENIPLYTINSLFLLGSKYFRNDGLYLVTNSLSSHDNLVMKVKVCNQEIEIISKDEITTSINQENFFIIDKSNYKVCPSIVINNSSLVTNIHDCIPNYVEKKDV